MDGIAKLKEAVCYSQYGAFELSVRHNLDKAFFRFSLFLNKRKRSFGSYLSSVALYLKDGFFSIPAFVLHGKYCNICDLWIADSPYRMST